MATKISKKKLRDVIDCILHNGSYLGKEASKLNVTVEDLKAQIETMYGGGRKNTQFKAILRNSQMNSSRVSSANPGKMQTSAQPKSNTTSAPKSSRATAVPVPNSPEDTTTAVTHTDSTPLLEDILKRKESLEEEFSVSEHVLAEAKEILKVREEILTKTKDVFEQAKAALNKAEKEQNEAQAAVSQAESDVAEISMALKKIDEEVQKIKDKVYLVSPWYSGSLPKYGTFISTVEMEHCIKQDVPSEYLPEMNVNGILLFEYVPDYKKARTFVGLVTMFELEGKAYTLLVSDNRVKELLKMSI